jgi:hypothetical protein
MPAYIHTYITRQSSALKQCLRLLNPYRPVFAFIEAYGTRDPIFCELEKSHLSSEQFAKWQNALSKFSISEQEIGSFRIKSRRLKVYIQEKLQVRKLYDYVCVCVSCCKTASMESRLDVHTSYLGVCVVCPCLRSLYHYEHHFAFAFACAFASELVSFYFKTCSKITRKS